MDPFPDDALSIARQIAATTAVPAEDALSQLPRQMLDPFAGQKFDQALADQIRLGQSRSRCGLGQFLFEFFFQS
jgi:hypothetical protein